MEDRSGGRFDLDDWLIDQDPHPQCGTDRLSYLGLGTHNLTTFGGHCLPPACSKPPVQWKWMDHERAMALFPSPAKIEHAPICGYFLQALQWDDEDEQEFIARWNHWTANPIEATQEVTSDEEEDDEDDEDADDSFDTGGIPDAAIARIDLTSELFGESPESSDDETATVDGAQPGLGDDIGVRSPPAKKQRIQCVGSNSH